MIPKPIHLFHPTGDDKSAVVSVQPSSSANAYLIQVARGTGKHLQKGTAYGPYPESEIAARFEEVVQLLKNEGFQPTGQNDLRQALQSKQSIVRARAAEKIGRRKITECVDALLSTLPNAVDDVCSIIDALGAIGDPKAIPVLREYAERKLLSRRRSAVEALRNLDDWEGLNDARNRALERLPETIHECLETVDENEKTGDGVQKLVDVIAKLQPQQQGLTLDTFYELATPATIAAVWEILHTTTYARPHIWRYIKSVFKRAMLRGDYTTFGMIAHQVERQGRGTSGVYAIVKSGYDGENRNTRIFNRRTQKYLRRGSWRYLRRLAQNQPDVYPWAASAALIPYSTEDEQLPKGLNGRFADCYVLGQILWGGGDRFRLDDRSLRRRFRDANSTEPTDKREESFPELWDAQPRAFLHVLGGAKLPEVHEFALSALRQRHMNIVREAKHAEIAGLLRTDYEPTLQLALTELERRFDPEQPDWPLIERLAEHDREVARALAGKWLIQTVAKWVTDVEPVVTGLALRHPDIRNVVVDLVIGHLPNDPAFRNTLAARVLAELQKPEETEGQHDGFARVARSVLLEEIDQRLQLSDILGLIDSGNRPAQGLAGDLLARHPEAVDELGLEKLTLLAQHEIVMVRHAAHKLIRSASEKFKQDASVLLVLVESDWDDTRALAFDMLKAMCDAGAISDDLLLGLLDSNRADVQNTACGIARTMLPKLNRQTLIEKLLEHPDPNMRWFVLELIDKQVHDVRLATVEQYFRNALLELSPDAKLKQRILDFVIDQGLQNEAQATIAIRILGEIARVKGRTDFERALEGLVRLKLQYPHIASPVALHMEGAL